MVTRPTKRVLVICPVCEQVVRVMTDGETEFEPEDACPCGTSAYVKQPEYDREIDRQAREEYYD